MSVYGFSALIISVYCALVGAFLIWLAARFDSEQVINFRRWSYLAGGFFFLLSIMFIPAFPIDALENGDQPPCEWLENRTNTTYRYGWNFSDGSYHWDYGGNPASNPSTMNADYINLFHTYEDRNYFNTCSSLTAPGYVSNLFIIQSWIIWAVLFSLFAGLLIYSIRVVGRIL